MPCGRTGKLTLQGLFSSKPGGAFTLSVCPRRYPVNLLSRSITGLCVSCCCLVKLPIERRTLPIPLVQRMSSSLSSILHVSYFRKARSTDAEHLVMKSVSPCRAGEIETHAKHDRIGNQSFEWDTHAVKGFRKSFIA